MFKRNENSELERQQLVKVFKNWLVILRFRVVFYFKYKTAKNDFLFFTQKGSTGEFKAGPHLTIHKSHIIGIKGLIFTE